MSSRIAKFGAFAAAASGLILATGAIQNGRAATGGLVAAYSFNEVAGTVLHDSSGNGNNGTLANATWASSGKYGSALSFNGSSSRVTIPNSNSLQLSSGMTLEAWVNPATVSSAWRDVIEKGSDNYYLMGTTDHGSNAGGGGIIGGNHGEAFTTNPLPINSWSFLTLSYDGTAVRLYLNGTQVAAIAKTGTITRSSNALTLGSDPFFGQYFNGLIDNIRIYNRARSGTEIQSDMNAPLAGGSSDSTAPSVPSGLAVSAVGQTSLTLSWAASSDNVGVTGYGVYKNGALTASPSGTSSTLSGLTCGTSYTLAVDAVDAAGNRSAKATLASSTASCTDTTPPSTPTGLAASGVGQSSATLSWTASTDNVGVTGYRLFQSGSQIGTSLTTSSIYSGLGCGSSYTLGVAAVDGAGNVSGTATLGVTTSACSGGGGSGTASLFVAPGGSDTCTRAASPTDFAHASGHVCASPVAACKLALSGDRVIVEDGSYSNVDFGGCTGHASYADNVVFQPEAGHECPMTYPDVPGAGTDTSCDVNFSFASGNGFIGGSNSACGVSGNPLPSTLSAAQRSSWINHLTIQGVHLSDFEMHCVAYITLKDDEGTYFYVRQGSYQVLIDGGDYGNNTVGSQPTIGDSTTSGSFPPAQAVTVQNAIIHDFTSNGSAHGDGWFIQPSYDVHIIKNIVARDDCIPFYVNYAAEASVGVHGLWITGNTIHVDTQHVVGNDRCYQALSLGSNTQTDTIIAFNSIEGNIIRHAADAGTTVSNNLIVGNVAAVSYDDSGAGCEPNYTAQYNVFYDSAATNCGDSSNALPNAQQFTSYDTAGWTGQVANSVYQVTALGDYSLRAGTAATAKVPTSWCNAHPGVCPTTDIDGNPRPNPAHPNFYDAGAYENR